MSKLQEALKRIAEILGSTYVLTGNLIPEDIRNATFFTRQKIPALIRPGNREEIQECLKIANQYGISFYPVSGGKNWGYGSMVPVKDSCILMMLDRMDKILEYNEKMAYITVEPGVTFEKVNNFLRSKNSRMFLNCPGNSSQASIIGVNMERGLIPGPEANRWEHMCGLEVVLPTGKCINTGFERYKNSKSSKISKQGIGPFIDGLFTQSNLGIVTKMTIWITPFPEFFQYFSFIIKDKENLANCIEVLRGLRMKGILGESCAIFNDYRVISFINQYPWEKTAGKTPLPEDILEYYRKMLGGGEWYGEGGITASCEEELAIKRKQLKKYLNNNVLELIFDPPNTENSYKNIQMNTSLSSIYWRKKELFCGYGNPNKDRCGVIWCAPVVPFDCEHVSECVHTIETILNEFGYEPGITIRCMTPRALYVLTGVIYDRDADGEDVKAMICYKKLFKTLNDKGYMPYRLGIQSMDDLPEADDDSGYFYKKIKNSLDPNNILAPGRYEIY